MKFLKIIIIIFIVIIFQNNLFAQSILSYSVKLYNNNEDVEVTLVLNNFAPDVRCDYYYEWSFNGYIDASKTEKLKTPIGVKKFYFNLNSATDYLIGNQFQLTIGLDITSRDEEGIPCVNTPYPNDVFVSYDLGTTNVLTTLDYSPKYPDGLPKNAQINFNYTFIPGSNTNLDHLKYYFKVDNQQVSLTYPVYYWSQLLTWQYSGFSLTGLHKIELIVERFGLQVGYVAMEITVIADPAPPAPPIASCISGVSPALQVDSRISDDKNKIDLTFTDISPSNFKNSFGGKSRYSILVTDADNIGYTVAGGKNINEFIFYPTSGFATLTRTYNLSAVIKPSYIFTVNFIAQCKATDGTITTQNAPTATISVPGKPFTPEENNVNVPPEGKLNQTVDIRAGYCKALLIDQPDSQLGSGNWVTNINLSGNFLTFDVAPNNSTVERNLGIKVFVNGYYDPCLAVEDGFTKTYRNIEVTQSTMFKDISNNPGELMPLPNMSVSPNVIYYSTQDYSSTKISGYFLKDFPLQLATWNSWTQLSNNIIKGYDANNKVIWQTTLTIVKWTCNDISSGSFDVSFFGGSNMYFAYIVHTQDNVDFIGAYQKGVIIVTSEKQITFKPGFQAKTGAILNASIQPCSALKSTLLKKDTTQSKINNLTPNFIDPQVIQEEKSSQSVSQVSIYPNPNDGKFSIDMRNLKESVIRIEIYNSAGTIQKILDKGIRTIETIDMNKAPSDTYFIKIISEKSIYNYKIIRL